MWHRNDPFFEYVLSLCEVEKLPLCSNMMSTIQQHMQQMDNLMNGMFNDDMCGGPLMHPMLNNVPRHGNGEA